MISEDLGICLFPRSDRSFLRRHYDRIRIVPFTRVLLPRSYPDLIRQRFVRSPSSLLSPYNLMTNGWLGWIREKLAEVLSTRIKSRNCRKTERKWFYDENHSLQPPYVEDHRSGKLLLCRTYALYTLSRIYIVRII